MKHVMLTLAVVVLSISIAGAVTRTTKQDLRQQIQKRNDTIHKLKVVNHRLTIAYLNGPGYVSPRDASWECIHSHEGAWNANTGNGYHGGLQMNSNFQSTYGPEFVQRWGGAENWPIWAQKLAADRAHAVRGYNPWPNTARMCGLL